MLSDGGGPSSDLRLVVCSDGDVRFKLNRAADRTPRFTIIINMGVLEASSGLMERAAERIMSEHLSFAILAASAVTLTVAYLSTRALRLQAERKQHGHVSTGVRAPGQRGRARYRGNGAVHVFAC